MIPLSALIPAPDKITKFFFIPKSPFYYSSFFSTKIQKIAEVATDIRKFKT